MNRRSLLLASATIPLAFASAAWADIRKTIAQKFNVEPDAFILNLPPRPGCLPGSVFTNDLRVPLTRTKLDDPDLDFGPPFKFSATLDTDMGANVGAEAGGWFGVAASASSIASVVIGFDDAHAIEILGSALKKRVLADSDALASAQRGVPPFVVLRSFQGKASLRMSKKDAASVDAWAKLQQTAIDARLGAKIAAGNTLEINVPEPFVFGFEIVQVNYVTQNLGTTPDEVNFVAVPNDLFVR
jgi:hypothetical protein